VIKSMSLKRSHDVNMNLNLKLNSNSNLNLSLNGYEEGHYVYMIRCKDQSLYTGYTTNVKRRIQIHLEGKGAKYTRGRGPFQLVFVETFQDKSEAMKREAEIKKYPRHKKTELITEGEWKNELEST
jgi:putative endonuclease